MRDNEIISKIALLPSIGLAIASATFAILVEIITKIEIGKSIFIVAFALSICLYSYRTIFKSKLFVLAFSIYSIINMFIVLIFHDYIQNLTSLVSIIVVIVDYILLYMLLKLLLSFSDYEDTSVNP